MSKSEYACKEIRERVFKKPKQLAWLARARLFNSLPSYFHKVDGTGAYIPKTEIIMHAMQNCSIKIVDSSENNDFEYSRCLVDGQWIIQYDSQLGEQRLRVLLLKLFYHCYFGINLPSFNNIKEFKRLSIDEGLKIFIDDRFQHVFAAEFIFGREDDFTDVAKKYGWNPVQLSDLYGVPIDYVTFQLAKYKILNSHYVSGMKGNVIRHIGGDKKLFELNGENDFLVFLLQKLNPKYYGKYVYRKKRFNGTNYICFGKMSEKRGKGRAHVFGFNSDYVSTTVMKGIKNYAEPFSIKMVA